MINPSSELESPAAQDGMVSILTRGVDRSPLGHNCGQFFIGEDFGRTTSLSYGIERFLGQIALQVDRINGSVYLVTSWVIAWLSAAELHLPQRCVRHQAKSALIGCIVFGRRCRGQLKQLARRKNIGR